MRARINVLMVLLDTAFPPDIRIEKEAFSLHKAGYKVHLLTLMSNKYRRFDIFNGIKIFRISPGTNFPFSRYFGVRALRYFIHLIQLPFIIFFFIVTQNIKIIHVHDLPYTIPTAFIGTFFRKKVIFDMHEDFIAMVASSGSKIPKISHSFLSFFEKTGCFLASKIIVVAEDEIERLSNLGIAPEKILVIHNSADTEKLDGIKLINVNKNFLKDKFVISYIGGFSWHRGLDTLIKAMPLILRKVPNAHLLLVGDAKTNRNLNNLCKQLHLEEDITFTGWVPYNKAMSFIKYHSNICVIPYHKTRHTDKALPHKLFQYMYLEKPILASNVQALKRVIEESLCGVIFKAGDSKDLADKVIKMWNHPTSLGKMGKNGKKAVIEKYNWKTTSKILCQTYYTLVLPCS